MSYLAVRIFGLDRAHPWKVVIVAEKPRDTCAGDPCAFWKQRHAGRNCVQRGGGARRQTEGIHDHHWELVGPVALEPAIGDGNGQAAFGWGEDKEGNTKI